MSSEPLVIIEHRSQIDRLISLAKGKVTLVALNNDVGRELVSRGLEFKTLEDYGLSAAYIEDECLKWFRSFPNIKIEDNKNIKEALVHDGISVWWLVDDMLYRSGFVFHSVQEIVRQVIILGRIIKTEEPTLICYAKNDTPASRATGLICKHRKIAAATVSPSVGIKRRLSKGVKASAYIYYYWVRMFLRKAYRMLLDLRYGSSMPKGKGKVLVFSGPAWVDVYDLETGERRRGDPYFDSAIELLRGENEIVFVDCATRGWCLSTMRERKRQRKIICRPFESYLNMRVILKALRASRKTQREYKALRQLAGFRDCLNFDGLPLYDLVGQNLSFSFSRRHLTMVFAIAETAKRMVDIENPDAIIFGGESVPHGRAIIASAKARGIPTVLAQHGFAGTSGFVYYYHIEEDIGPNGEATAPYCPIADKFFMYGEYDKDVLVKHARFAEEDLVVTGQPRYDILAKADKVFDRERIFSRLNLDPRKKLITWMTVSFGFTPQENERNINAVYGAMKSLSDIQLVVKLHPGENQKAPLYRKSKSFKPTIVGGWGTITFELLYASDIMVTHDCTTAIEALMLDKPVILIDFTDRPVPVVYVEAGAAIGIYKENALAPAIESLLHDEEARQRLAAAREKFISEGNYKPDGQASQRVVDLIKQMSRGQREAT